MAISSRMEPKDARKQPPLATPRPRTVDAVALCCVLVLHGAVAMPSGPRGLSSLGGCVGDELDWCLTALLSQFQAG
jgi:hypothetical protein